MSNRKIGQMQPTSPQSAFEAIPLLVAPNCTGRAVRDPACLTDGGRRQVDEKTGSTHGMVRPDSVAPRFAPSLQ